MFDSSSGWSQEHTKQLSFLFFFVSDDFKCRNHPHLPQIGDVYFGLKNQYKIVLNVVKKKNLYNL